MNKRERVLATFRNEIPDRVPAAFWFHNKADDSIQELVEKHIKLYRYADMDYMKIMYDLGYSLPQPVAKASDWYKINPMGRESPYGKKQLAVVRGILDALQGECLVYVTLFGAMRHALWCQDITEESLWTHYREDPTAVKCGLRAIAETIAEWADSFFEAGVDGLFYSAQYGELTRFSEEDWAELVRPVDLIVLNAVKDRNDHAIILHICGQPHHQCKTELHRFVDYPMHMVNWATAANHVSLQKGYELFRRPVLGGLDNEGAIMYGPAEQVEKDVKQVLQEYGTRGFILGADCSLHGSIPADPDLIRVGVQTAHQFQSL